MSARLVFGWRALVAGALVCVLAGCGTFRGSSCHEPGPYASAQSVPPLKVPPGLHAPDTRNALRVPELNEPEPPPRKAGDPCLDAPPRYSTGSPQPQPQG